MQNVSCVIIIGELGLWVEWRWSDVAMKEWMEKGKEKNKVLVFVMICDGCMNEKRTNA